MKMNKILAAGVAATMAVTSFAAVVSAEEKSFSMAQTVGTSELKDVLAYFFTDNNAANNGIDGAAVTGWTLKVAPKAGSGWTTVTGATMEVTGTRLGSTTTTTEKYALADGDWDGVFTMEFVSDYVNQAGQANLSSFDKITGVKLLVSVKKDNIFTATEYDALNGLWGDGQSLVTVTGGEADASGFFAAMIASDPADAWYNADRSTRDLYHFIEKTTDDVTIDRVHVMPLSITGAHGSFGSTGADGNQTGDPQGYGSNPNGFAGLAGQVARFFNKQTNGTITFKFSSAASNGGTNWNNGGIPSTETGLLGDSMKSTAFALFFNYNATTGSLVSVGEVDADALTVTFDIADVLDALNGNTIGTIQDIFYGMNKGVKYVDTEILSEDNQGNTIVEKVTAEGYLVESVTLAYDEDAADDTDIEEDDDDDDAPVVDDDDDTDDVADDDDDATIDEDDDDDDYVDDDADDDDDTDVDGDVDEPVTPADDDDDANPGTGVALAVVPALVAAAAVVVSKKRK
ncbi:MAG: hypothetical protein ACI4J7_02985 [Ruminiclostridium sp.]